MLLLPKVAHIRSQLPTGLNELQTARYLNVFSSERLQQLTSRREGETKAGEQIRVLPEQVDSLDEALTSLRNEGVRYGVLLVPEDIGPRANLGRGGAHQAPEAFIKYLINVQANRYFDYRLLAIIGSVEVSDLMEASTNTDKERLRDLCHQLDGRVIPLVQAIAKSGICPIVIGGGNNNSFPTIAGVCNALRDSAVAPQLAVVNCDPHADFRRLEGRHSGNPFSYAADRNLLKRYAVFGMHENYNNEEMLKRLMAAGFKTFSYEDFAISGKTTFEQSLADVVAYLDSGKCPVGCEVDIDGIKFMPASARTPFGITEEQAARLISRVASSTDTAYLHLSEGAPDWGTDEGALHVGKALALLTITFMKAREQRREIEPEEAFTLERCCLPPIKQ